MRSRLPSRSPTTVLICARASRTEEAYRFATLRRKHHDRITAFAGRSAPATAATPAGGSPPFLDGPAEVTLRLPPPLDRPLAVEARDGGVVLLDGDAVVAEARPAAIDVEPPVRPTFAEAEAAAARHVRMPDERFGECFTCGVRVEADGLCIYAGPLEDGVVHAAPWTPAEVAPEIVWAAIDCPGAFAVGGPGRGEMRARTDGRRAAAPAGRGRALRGRRVAARRGRAKAPRRDGAARRGRRPARPRAPDLDSAENRVATAPVEAVGGEERNPDPAAPERVHGWFSLRLRERVDGEPAGAVEPQLVARALERGQQRVAVPGGAVAEPGALRLTVCASTTR